MPRRGSDVPVLLFVLVVRRAAPAVRDERCDERCCGRGGAQGPGVPHRHFNSRLRKLGGGRTRDERSFARAKRCDANALKKRCDAEVLVPSADRPESAALALLSFRAAELSHRNLRAVRSDRASRGATQRGVERALQPHLTRRDSFFEA